MSQKRFPYAWEVKVPKEMEGWEEMYPDHRLFTSDRQDWDQDQFWYTDKIHAPDPMVPLDEVFHQAWQIALSQHTTRIFCIPPAQGIAHRMLGCYLYITAIAPPPLEIIQAKAEKFGQRTFPVFGHYEELWGQWRTRQQELGRELQAVKVPKELPQFVPDFDSATTLPAIGPAQELIEAFNHAVNIIYRGWQYHFTYLNLSYLAYLMFADVARKLFPGISESAIGKMVAGADVSMFRPEEELCRLARLAHTRERVANILKADRSANAKIESLREFEDGRMWLESLSEVKDPWFMVSCGSGWFHYEGSWIDKLDVPFSYLKGYLERLDRGERIERSLSAITDARDAIIAEYRGLIKSDEDRKTFEDAYNNTRTIYRYAEDHLFWVEHWFHTIWFEKMREFGRLFVKQGVLKETDDFFMFNRLEIPSLIEDVATSWALGENIPTMKWAEKAEKRKKILAAAAQWSPPPALGVPPEVVAEPFTVMLWGVTTERVTEWLEGASGQAGSADELKGFASSAGVVEGKARVLKRLEDIVTLEQDDIMVVPNTNPAWAPIFSKIKAAVTDIGGITSHAAIVCREYGVPSVTGTGSATTAIKTGDWVKVDGDRGLVTIVKRAE
ncbi:MAG: PEP-utilizing enzyme, mobile region [Caldilineales bacterium]|nr:PEP-utilizing enzyme, mobile region [Caldilineales bacterium]